MFGGPGNLQPPWSRSVRSLSASMRKHGYRLAYSGCQLLPTDADSADIFRKMDLLPVMRLPKNPHRARTRLAGYYCHAWTCCRSCGCRRIPIAREPYHCPAWTCCRSCVCRRIIARRASTASQSGLNAGPHIGTPKMFEQLLMLPPECARLWGAIPEAEWHPNW